MNNNRTIGIIATVVTAIVCCFAAIFAGVTGGLVASGAPVTLSGSNGVSTSQTYPPAIGYTLLGLSIIFILIPFAVGFFTLRKKP